MFSEDIKILCVKRNKSVAELSRNLGDTRQNMQSKMRLESFKAKDLKEMCKALNVTMEINYKDANTGETIYKSTL